MNLPRTLTQVADIQTIRQVLAQHSRGVDRTDVRLLSDCYHDDATLDYGFYKGAARDFPAILVGALRGQPVSLHRTGHMWVSLNGAHAKSESYVIALAQSADEDGVIKQRLICGRYLDRHERRDGRWRIAHRTYVLDTNCNWPGEHRPPENQSLESHVPSGGQGAADAGTAILALAAAKNRQESEGEQGMSEDAPTAVAVDAAISRQQIADLTMAYCRGLDRADEALLKSIFHDDSTVVSGAFNGSGHAFATEICTIVRAVFDQTFHSIANQWIDVTGDTAIGETYVIAVSTMTDPEEGKSEMLTGGRYIDRFTRRDGVWKFAERSFVSDWSRIDKTTRDMDTGLYASLDLQGKQGPDDPVYAMWH